MIRFEVQDFERTTCHVELDTSKQNSIILPPVPPNRAGRQSVVAIGSHHGTGLLGVRTALEVRYFAVRSQRDVPWGPSSALKMSTGVFAQGYRSWSVKMNAHFQVEGSEE